MFKTSVTLFLNVFTSIKKEIIFLLFSVRKILALQLTSTALTHFYLNFVISRFNFDLFGGPIFTMRVAKLFTNTANDFHANKLSRMNIHSARKQTTFSCKWSEKNHFDSSVTWDVGLAY